MDDTYYMSLALLEAENAVKRGDVPVGALLVRNGEVLAAASNAKANDPTAHAEIRAMRLGSQFLGSWNLRDCTLYVTLEPCPMCAGACINARLGSLVFGAWDPKAGAAGTLYDILRDTRLNHRCEVRSGVLEARCSGILKDYFIERRKVRYPVRS